MSDQPEPIYVRPFANVRLVECRDYIALVPVCAYRQFVGYGKMKRGGVFSRLKKRFAALWAGREADEDAWVVMEWKRFEDGHEEPGIISYLTGSIRARP